MREPSGSRIGTLRPSVDDVAAVKTPSTTDHKAPCCDPDEHRRCSGSWRGVISLGYDPAGKRIRTKVRGQTKTEVRDKLRDLHSDIEAGIASPVR
jgi:hypothetical protein